MHSPKDPRFRRTKGISLKERVGEVLKKGQRAGNGGARGALPSLSRRRLLLLVACVAALAVTMAPPPLFPSFAFREGEVFPYDIRAFRTVRYLSEVETERRRQEVAAAVPRQYRKDPSVSDHWTAVLNDLFEAVRQLSPKPYPLSEKVLKLRQRFGFAVPDQVFATLLQASPATLRLLQDTLLSGLRREWERGIKPTEKDRRAALERVGETLRQLPLTADLRWALTRLTEVTLKPNMVYDPEATQRLRERVKATVPSVWRTLKAGELIARKGEMVTEEHLEKLRALGYNFPAFLRTLVWALLLSAFVAAFLAKGVPEVFGDDRRLLLLALLWLPPLFLARVVGGWVGAEGQVPMMATAAMLTTVLVSPAVSLLAAWVFALAVTLGNEVSFRLGGSLALPNFFVLITVGVAVPFVTEKIRTREDLLKGGIGLSLVAAGVQLAARWASGEGWGTEGVKGVLVWSVVTGALPTALTVLLLSVLERTFGVVTVWTLMELASPHAPLLKELAEKAPGTYQSSLMVARLAQEAAKRIGANDLLAWVGGLYHDIGKLSRPQYFVENLPDGAANPHDRLSPQMSAKVLLGHVQAGIQLAQQHRLPQPIIDIIKEHHGTSVMTYFLAKAKERGELLNEADYRYGGPKPRSKESALIMLADSVEAAVKALSDPTPQQWESVVEEVVQGKLSDGQLSDAPLTLRDLEEIKRAFKDTLKSIYHHRIEYPKEAPKSHAKQGFGPSDRPSSSPSAMARPAEA